MCPGPKGAPGPSGPAEALVPADPPPDPPPPDPPPAAVPALVAPEPLLLVLPALPPAPVAVYVNCATEVGAA